MMAIPQKLEALERENGGTGNLFAKCNYTKYTETNKLTEDMIQG